MLQEWKKYEAGKKYNGRLDPPYYETVNLNLDFFNGNQWKNLKSNGMPTPVFNILKRGVQFFVASLMSNRVKVNFTPLEYRDDGIEGMDVSEIATNEVENLFDKFNMDNRIRDALFDAGVMGDVAAHFYWDTEAKPYNGTLGLAEGEIGFELIDGTNIYFGNPNSPIVDVKTQPYIIISGRDLVKNLKDEAKLHRNNADIKNDNDVDDIAGSQGNIELDIDGDDDKKAKYIIYYYYDKETKTIKVSKLCEKEYIYKDIDTGLTRYPIAWLVWEKQKNQYHGRAICTSMIPNQIFINRMFAMVMYHLMMSAFPKAVYDADKIPAWSNEIGQAIPIHGIMPGDSIKSLAGYLEPGNMSSQIIQAIELTIQYTKECLGVNEAMMGDINPESASGKSIIATVQQSVVPLENVRANLYEWCEEIGRILLDMMGNYYGQRPLVITDENGNKQVIEFDFNLLRNVYLYTKCDVGASSYWSEIASVETLENLLQAGHIDIIEFLESVPNNFLANKLELISKVKQRLESQDMIPEMPEIPENLNMN